MPAAPLVLVFVVAFIAAGLASVDQPARSSSIPRLVPPERLPAAIALNQLNFQAASIVGPAIGGLLIATIGLAGAYAVDFLSFGASIVALLAHRPDPAARPGLAAGHGRDPRGPAYVRGRRLVLSTFAIDLAAMIFGMPTALFPALAIDVFGTGAIGVGLMAAAPGLGAFFGALLSGWVAAVRRPGPGRGHRRLGLGPGHRRVRPGDVLVPARAGLFLAIAGAADVLSAVFRATIVQLDTPDHLRGRVTSVHILVVTSGPRIGDLEAAVVASIAGVSFSVVSGGLLCLAGVGLVVRAFPELMAHVLPSRGGRLVERAPEPGVVEPAGPTGPGAA